MSSQQSGKNASATTSTSSSSSSSAATATATVSAYQFYSCNSYSEGAGELVDASFFADSRVFLLLVLKWLLWTVAIPLFLLYQTTAPPLTSTTTTQSPLNNYYDSSSYLSFFFLLSGCLYLLYHILPILTIGLLFKPAKPVQDGPFAFSTVKPNSFFNLHHLNDKQHLNGTMTQTHSNNNNNNNNNNTAVTTSTTPTSSTATTTATTTTTTTATTTTTTTTSLSSPVPALPVHITPVSEVSPAVTPVSPAALLKHVLIILNPYGGNQIATQVYQQQVSPFLQKHHITAECIQTEYSGHARDIMATKKILNWQTYQAILIIGGDGTVAEVVNGLCSRKEMESIMKDAIQNIQATSHKSAFDFHVHELPPIPPLCAIPCGSGNALSLDLSSWDIQLSLSWLIKGHIAFMDVNYLTNIPMEKPQGTPRVKSEKLSKIRPLSLLSINEISLGLVGNVAVVAEFWRSLGSARYDLCAVWTVLRGVKEYMKLKWTEKNNKVETREGLFDTLFINQTQHFGKGLRGCPYAKLDDGLFDICLLRDGATRADLLALFQNLPTGAHATSPFIVMRHAKEIEIETKNNISVINVDGDNVVYEGRLKIQCLRKVIPIYCDPHSKGPHFKYH